MTYAVMGIAAIIKFIIGMVWWREFISDQYKSGSDYVIVGYMGIGYKILLVAQVVIILCYVAMPEDVVRKRKKID